MGKIESVKLREVLDRLVADPKLQPGGGKTYCNVFTTMVCEEYDITDFQGLLANQMYDLMISSNKWRQIDGEIANKVANNGGIALAAQKGKPHGHICPIYPGAMVWSTKWAMECPVVANVGKRNGVMGVNWAFAKEPDYFARKTT